MNRRVLSAALRPTWDVLSRDHLVAAALVFEPIEYLPRSATFCLLGHLHSHRVRAFASPTSLRTPLPDRGQPLPPLPPPPTAHPTDHRGHPGLAGVLSVHTCGERYIDIPSSLLVHGPGKISSSHGQHPPLPSTMKDLIAEMQASVSEGRYQDALFLFRASDDVLISPACRQDPVAMAAAYDHALKACAACGAADHALHLVGTMWRRKVPVGRVAHGSLLKALCQAGRREEALKRLKSISSKRVTSVMVNTVLGACAAADDAALGLRAWAFVRGRKGLPIDAVTWCEALRVHGACGDVAGVESTWNEAVKALQKTGNAKSDETERSMVAAARVAGLTAAADFPAAIVACESLMEDLSHLLPIQLEIPGALEVKSATRSGVEELGSEEKKKTKTAERSPRGGGARREANSLQHLRTACNTVLHEAGRRYDMVSMRRLVHLMTSRGVTPDTITYNALLAQRRGDGSTTLIEGIAEMEALGLRPNATTYSLLMEAHAAEGDIEGTQKAFRELKGSSSGDDPDAAAWAAIFVAFGRAGDLAGLTGAYDEMIAKRKFERDDLGTVYQAAFTALRTAAAPLRFKLRANAGSQSGEIGSAPRGGAGDRPAAWRLADELLQRMEVDAKYLLLSIHGGGGVFPPTTLSALVMAHGILGHENAVLRYMMEQYGVRPADSRPGEVGDDNLLLIADVHQHQDQIKHAEKKSASLDHLLMNALSDSSCGDRQSAVHCMATCRAAPDLRVFNSAVAALGRYCGRLDLCLPLLLRMKEVGVPPDGTTYATMIAACASPPRPQLARQIVDHAEKMSLSGSKKLSSRIFNAYLHVQCICHGVESADLVLNEMEERGVSPDAITWTALRTAALQQGNQDVAERAALQLELLQGVGRGGPVALEEVETEMNGDGGGGGGGDGTASGNGTALSSGGGGGGQVEKHWCGYYASDEDDEW